MAGRRKGEKPVIHPPLLWFEDCCIRRSILTGSNWLYAWIAQQCVPMGTPIRVHMHKGVPHFALADLCEALGRDHHAAARVANPSFPAHAKLTCLEETDDGIFQDITMLSPVAGVYGAVAGAGQGDGLSERLVNSGAMALVTGATGGLSPLALRAGGALTQQARLRGPGVDAAARTVDDSLQRVANVGRQAIGRAPSRIAPPSARAQPQANRMIAEAISSGPIRQGPNAAQQAAHATPEAVAAEVERRAALNVPTMVGDVSAPLAHATGWASRGIGQGQQMVRTAIAERKAAEALRLRQHVTDTLGPVVDPRSQSLQAE